MKARNSHINFRGADIAYRIKGEGKAIVLLHGFLESGEIWNYYQDTLAKSYRVLSIDLPGHGKSGCIGYVHTMDLMAESVRQVLLKENIKGAAFVGHSMGGYVSLALGDRYPDMIKGMCMFNSTALADSPQRVVNRNRALEAVRKNASLFVAAAIPALFHSTKGRGIKQSIERIRKIGMSTSQRGVLAAIEGMKIRPDRQLILRFAPYPVKYIIGKKDPVIPFTQYMEELSQNENIQAYITEEGGHMCFIEDKENCLKEVTQFVRSIRYR